MLFAACATQAGELDCNALAKQYRLAGKSRTDFLKECLVDQARAKDEKPIAPLRQPEAVGAPLAGGCASVEHCGDLSVQLQPAAAGLGGGSQGNSGHSFVRVRRIAE